MPTDSPNVNPQLPLTVQDRGVVWEVVSEVNGSDKKQLAKLGVRFLDPVPGHHFVFARQSEDSERSRALCLLWQNKDNNWTLGPCDGKLLQLPPYASLCEPDNADDADNLPWLWRYRDTPPWLPQREYNGVPGWPARGLIRQWQDRLCPIGCELEHCCAWFDYSVKLVRGWESRGVNVSLQRERWNDPAQTL